ncbi:NADP-dependent oxidoreductase [Hymenobacter sp. 15J16-1T3B]|uniref:NADP-dependent oxidoreductase n=1 Tax=Hymenobacter sp. 15J16-1T3B TaxID=2886941 RepID=UPI001D1139C4|nr:NADP-dependent oxidoreductase [Hymenobacter sp. 15J16-1T3B]MCC3160580.1 NADP-dependent oxidoreductase [Hymenobacter sp. 15J16-1T3B]
MQAFILTEPTGGAGLRLTDLPTPTPATGEVLVQVKAISLNPVDVKTAQGKAMYGRINAEPPVIPGWDISGVVSAVGAEVADFKVGDEVFGMVNFPGHGRAYAEYVAAPAAHLARKPSNISHAEAAAATLAALTAWQAFTAHAPVQAGQRVLVHAAAGGVGHFAVQLAKERGAYVIGTSSAAKRDFVRDLGADEHVDYQAGPFEQAVAPVDVVLDTVGGPNLVRSASVLKPGGRLVSILGMTPEATARAEERGATTTAFLVESNGAQMQELAARLADGRLRAHVSAALPFAELPAALRLVETGRTQGKVVVTL